MIEYLLIFILSVIFSVFWEWTNDKHKKIWYFYAGLIIVIGISTISSIIFNPQSLEREALTSEGIPLIILSWVGWIVGEKIYNYE